MNKLTVTLFLVMAFLGPLAGYVVGYSQGHAHGLGEGANDEGRRLSDTLGKMAADGHLVSVEHVKQ